MIEYRFSQQEGLDLLGLFRKNIKTINGKPVEEWLEEHECHVKTCKKVNKEGMYYYDFLCSECGHYVHDFLMEHEGVGVIMLPNYCPNCGAKVVE